MFTPGRPKAREPYCLPTIIRLGGTAVTFTLTTTATFTFEKVKWMSCLAAILITHDIASLVPWVNGFDVTRTSRHFMCEGTIEFSSPNVYFGFVQAARDSHMSLFVQSHLFMRPKLNSRKEPHFPTLHLREGTIAFSLAQRVLWFFQQLEILACLSSSKATPTLPLYETNKVIREEPHFPTCISPNVRFSAECTTTVVRRHLFQQR